MRQNRKAEYQIQDLQALQLETDRRMARATFAVLLLPSLWFFRTDLALQLSADLLGARFAVRAVLLIVLVAAVWRLRRAEDRASYERTVLVASLIGTACVVAVTWLRPQGSAIPLRTPLLWLFALYGGLHLPLARQLIAPLTLSASLLVVRVFWGTSDAMGTLDGDIVVLLMMNAIGYFLARNRTTQVASETALWEAEREAKASLERTLKELRVLRGIIPICSFCRQVRTEVGDWERLERYVRQHSSADFSHGVCPDCALREFPDLVPAPPSRAGH